MSDIDATVPGFAQISDTNHSSWVLVGSYIFFLIAVLVTIIRLTWRYKVTQTVSLDDWLMTVATVIAIPETASITISCRNGLGRPLDTLSASEYDSYSKSLYAAQILTIVILALAKSSVTQTIITLRPHKSIVRACYALHAFIALWGLSSIFALAFQCSLPRPWDFHPDRCVDQFALQVAIGVLNILSDFALIILPLVLMAKVQVGQRQRVVIGGLFGCRIIVPIMAILSLTESHDFYRSATVDRTWEAVMPILYAQIMLYLSLITGSIPSIKRFLAEFRSFASAAEVTADFEMSMSGRKGPMLSSSQNSNSHVDHNEKGTQDYIKSGDRLGPPGNTSSHGRRSTSRKPGLFNRSLSQLGNQFKPSSSSNGKNPVSAASIYDNREPANTTVERSESVRGLTDNVIMQTIDYKIEYQDKRHQARGARHVDDDDDEHDHEQGNAARHAHATSSATSHHKTSTDLTSQPSLHTVGSSGSHNHRGREEEADILYLDGAK